MVEQTEEELAVTRVIARRLTEMSARVKHGAEADKPMTQRLDELCKELDEFSAVLFTVASQR